MAGRGSRFSKAGYQIPKPLVKLNGYPFFWWAIMSVERSVEVKTLTCVILEEHIEEFDIKNKVLSFFPEANFVVLPDITDGALDSAVAGLEMIDNDYPVIINDCDQAFEANCLSKCIEVLNKGQDVNGFLCHFKSDSPSYSYAQYDESKKLIRTVEKEVISNLAIAGAYIFENRTVINRYFEDYKKNCTYSETYISGLYNLMISNGEVIKGLLLDSHLSFGTPEELSVANDNLPYKHWLS